MEDKQVGCDSDVLTLDQETSARLLRQVGLFGATQCVYDFHVKLNVPTPGNPCWPGSARMNLRANMNDEEYDTELAASLGALTQFLTVRKLNLSSSFDQYSFPEEDRKEFRRLMTNVADGIIDTIYVLVGMGLEMGMRDLGVAWERVHAANMAKDGGGQRGDGKILKPPGWVAPDVEGAIFGDGT